MVRSTNLFMVKFKLLMNHKLKLNMIYYDNILLLIGIRIYKAIIKLSNIDSYLYT